MKHKKFATDTKAPKLNDEQRMILSTLVFVARLGTIDPPSEWDRLSALNSLRAAALRINPSFASDAYYEKFFAGAK